MSSELDAIKARQHARDRWNGGYGGMRSADVRTLVAALEAVLAIHPAEATGYGDWVCGACISAGSHDWESTAYPCPTVTAIQSALGETDANN